MVLLSAHIKRLSGLPYAGLKFLKWKTSFSDSIGKWIWGIVVNIWRYICLSWPSFPLFPPNHWWNCKMFPLAHSVNAADPQNQSSGKLWPVKADEQKKVCSAPRGACQLTSSEHETLTSPPRTTHKNYRLLPWLGTMRTGKQNNQRCLNKQNAGIVTGQLAVLY